MDAVKVWNTPKKEVRAKYIFETVDPDSAHTVTVLVLNGVVIDYAGQYALGPEVVSVLEADGVTVPDAALSHHLDGL